MKQALNKIKEDNLPKEYEGYKVYKRMDSHGDYLQLFSSSLNSDLDDRFRSIDELKTFVDEKL